MSGRLRVLTVVGNRPQFIKAAAVSGPLREVADEVLVHTGQHHDESMSQVFFDELGIPEPDFDLGISGGSNADQVEAMTVELLDKIQETEPDWVLLYGDTNSTLAGALAAEQAGVPVAHVEAGMRSFDLAMPEEVNRIETDRRSALLLCSTETAVHNIATEGLGARVELVGDVMADVVRMVSDRLSDREEILERFGVEQDSYILITAHRAGNVDTEEGLSSLIAVLEALPGAKVFPVHPRTLARASEFGLKERLDAVPGIQICGPLGYVDFQYLLAKASALVTDSGGAQKEAYLHGVRCVTMRTTTEWTETVAAGWNFLVGLDAQAARSALEKELPSARPNLYGDARAGERVVAALRLQD